MNFLVSGRSIETNSANVMKEKQALQDIMRRGSDSSRQDTTTILNSVVEDKKTKRLSLPATFVRIPTGKQLSFGSLHEQKMSHENPGQAAEDVPDRPLARAIKACLRPLSPKSKAENKLGRDHIRGITKHNGFLC